MFGSSSLITVLIGTPMTLTYGVTGAIWTWALASAVGFGFGLVIMRRHLTT
jgi:hypothetical protein